MGSPSRKSPAPPSVQVRRVQKPACPRCPSPRLHGPAVLLVLPKETGAQETSPKHLAVCQDLKELETSTETQQGWVCWENAPQRSLEVLRWARAPFCCRRRAGTGGMSPEAVPRGVPTRLCLVARSGRRVDGVEQVVGVQHRVHPLAQPRVCRPGPPQRRQGLQRCAARLQKLHRWALPAE